MLSISGLVLGAIAGSRLAPSLLPEGRESIWLPLVALGGAVLGAVLAQALLFLIASPLRRRVQRGSARRIDQGAGVVLGAGLGLAIAWLVAAAIVFQPLDRAAGLRDEVRRSSILRAALSLVPPDQVLGALARVDAFTFIPLPAAVLPEPDPSTASSPAALRARGAVVELRGRACGLVKQGTGWVIAEDLVATNAHVIAGQDDTQALLPGGPSASAEPVYVDAANDVALLRIDAPRHRAPHARRRPARAARGRAARASGRRPPGGRGGHRVAAAHGDRPGRLRRGRGARAASSSPAAASAPAAAAARSSTPRGAWWR